MTRFRLTLAGVGLALSSASASAQSTATSASFSITPGTTVLAGNPLTIALVGVPPRSQVRVDAERLVFSSFHNGKRLLFRSHAEFASGKGTVDLGSAAPTSGSYAGVDVRGLFWSMVATSDSVPTGAQPNQVRLRARVGGRVVADTTIVFLNALPEVRVEQVAAFPGALLASLPGGGRRPVIIILGGSDGGSRAAREAPKFASQGYAVLGLPYHSPAAGPRAPRELPELPADFADIPVERLNAVYDWLRTRDDVDPERIALYGSSKGAEMALLAASHFPWIRAVVAVAPSDVVWEGWGWGVIPGTRSSFSLNGTSLPYVPFEGFLDEMANMQSGAPIHIRRFHDRGRAAHPEAVDAARIPIERFRGKLMLVAGEDDQSWNSAAMTRSITARRAAAGLETVALIFPDAGHLLNGNGWSPTTHYNVGQEQSGGTPMATARAQAEVWTAMLDFLRNALR